MNLEGNLEGEEQGVCAVKVGVGVGVCAFELVHVKRTWSYNIQRYSTSTFSRNTCTRTVPGTGTRVQFK